MRTCCIAQGTLLNGLQWSEPEGSPKGSVYVNADVYVWLIPLAVQRKWTVHGVDD